MTAVARLLPRDWDGGRLLRFLAGLAMLALAFTAPAATATPSEPVPVVASIAAEETSVTVSESVPAPSPVRVLAVPSLPEGLPVLALTTLTVLLSLMPRVRGERAPPAV